MGDFSKGDRVKVTLDDVLVIGEGYSDRYQSDYLRVVLAVNGFEVPGNVHLDGQGVTVEHANTDPWPPRPGDVWKDRDGVAWFAVEDDGSMPFTRTGLPYLMTSARDVFPALEVPDTFGPLTLIYREPVQSKDGAQ